MVRNKIYLKELKKNLFRLKGAYWALRKYNLSFSFKIYGLYNFESNEYFSFKSYLENQWIIDDSSKVIEILKARHSPEILNLNLYKPKFESLTMVELYCWIINVKVPENNKPDCFYDFLLRFQKHMYSKNKEDIDICFILINIFIKDCDSFKSVFIRYITGGISRLQNLDKCCVSYNFTASFFSISINLCLFVLRLISDVIFFNNSLCFYV